MSAVHEAANFTWGVGDWIAFGMLALTVLGMVAGAFVMTSKISHRFGEHHQRLATAEREIKDLKTADRNAETDRQELAVLNALLTRVENAVRDMGHDLNRRMDAIEGDLRRYLGRREGER